MWVVCGEGLAVSPNKMSHFNIILDLRLRHGIPGNSGQPSGADALAGRSRAEGSIGHTPGRDASTNSPRFPSIAHR
jgi:hypothetical protein